MNNKPKKYYLPEKYKVQVSTFPEKGTGWHLITIIHDGGKKTGVVINNCESYTLLKEDGDKIINIESIENR